MTLLKFVVVIMVADSMQLLIALPPFLQNKNKET
jgi:hypothetical protein